MKEEKEIERGEGVDRRGSELGGKKTKMEIERKCKGGSKKGKKSMNRRG